MHMVGPDMPVQDLDVVRSRDLSDQIPQLDAQIAAEYRLAMVGDEQK
jgi:hypothetical protein